MSWPSTLQRATVRPRPRANCYHGVMPTGNGSSPATQADIQSVRSDLQGVKSELKEDFKRVAVEVVKTNARMTQMEDALRKEIALNANRVITVLDRLVKTTEAANRAAVLHGQMLSEHAETLGDHGKRLSRLESAP